LKKYVKSILIKGVTSTS